MKQVITVKLKLSTDAAQFQALRRAQLAYRDALNAVSRNAFAHGKMSNQQALQRACYKGTRAATRRLVVVSGRERRLKQERNHLISRRIVDAYPHALIGLEHLTHIRERTRRPRGKRASAKQRKANRHASQWLSPHPCHGCQ